MPADFCCGCLHVHHPSSSALLLLLPLTETPWADELEHKVFKSSVGIGPYIEVAFFHKKTRSLLVTDAVVQVPQTPPEVGVLGVGPWGWLAAAD